MTWEKKIIETMQRGVSSPLVAFGLRRLLQSSKTRKPLIASIEKAMYKISLDDSVDRPAKVKLDRFYMARALLNSIDRAFETNAISKNTSDRLTKVFLSEVLIKGIHKRRHFKDEHGFSPPGFVTISPTNSCNLKCKGCYAGDIECPSVLDFDVFDRIITEMKTSFHSNFFVISGGEPFMYKSKGKTLFDILKKHNDSFFLVYTNGTLLNKENTARLGELGNATPAISVEGFHEDTDSRRGKGVFKKIISAMENLKKHGVIFGISVTPCSHNADLLLSEEFIDFYFDKMGVSYGWYFQYMPIGREPNLEVAVTPRQRLNMYNRIWEIIRRKKIFIADFWNCGTVSDGCISSARGGGYFYIMWDGTVTPCVFVPFADKEYNNINDVYNRGENLMSIIYSPFFTAIRKWQDGYWINQPKERCGNLLAPCIIRDNSRVFAEIVAKTGAQPIDKGAENYLQLIREGKMPEYNNCWRELTEPIWKRDYLKNPEHVTTS